MGLPADTWAPYRGPRYSARSAAFPLLLRDDYIVDGSFNETGRTRVRRLNDQLHGLARECIQTRGCTAPGRIEVGSRRDALKHHTAAAWAHNGHAQEVCVRGVRAVRQILVERE